MQLSPQGHFLNPVNLSFSFYHFVGMRTGPPPVSYRLHVSLHEKYLLELCSGQLQIWPWLGERSKARACLGEESNRKLSTKVKVKC